MRTRHRLSNGKTAVLHWRHWLPRFLLWAGNLFAKAKAKNMAVTIDQERILVAQGYLAGETLEHEEEHTEQAAREGWRYIPNRIIEYALHGIETGPGEADADARAGRIEFHPDVVTPELGERV